MMKHAFSTRFIFFIFMQRATPKIPVNLNKSVLLFFSFLAKKTQQSSLTSYVSVSGYVAFYGGASWNGNRDYKQHSVGFLSPRCLRGGNHLTDEVRARLIWPQWRSQWTMHNHAATNWFWCQMFFLNTSCKRPNWTIISRTFGASQQCYCALHFFGFGCHVLLFFGKWKLQSAIHSDSPLLSELFIAQIRTEPKTPEQSRPPQIVLGKYCWKYWI